MDFPDHNIFVFLRFVLESLLSTRAENEAVQGFAATEI